MTREEFQALINSKIVILDGATGSNLQQSGMEKGACPERWIMEHKDILIQLQKEYVEAGSDILYAPTFTANRVKLAEYGLEDSIEEINRTMVSLSKEAIRIANVDRKVYVAADITMTGEQLYPVGQMAFEDLVNIYKEQVRYLYDSGVDLFVIETMMSLNECRAAVLAVKETCDLPVMVTLTFKEDMRTFYGTDPVTAVMVLQNMGVDAVGANCSTGPDKMCQVIERMKEYATIPIIAKPNAGLPKLVEGKTVFDMGPEEFAGEMKGLVEAGASIVGGCCGTTVDHMKRMVEEVSKLKMPTILSKKTRALCTERSTTFLPLQNNFVIVGERINPTGKKDLQAQLREGIFDIVNDMAIEQVERGAGILDINMGMNGIDEKDMMIQAVHEVSRTVDVPLSIDSSHVDVIEAALRIYPGRALINSISFEKEKMQRLIPIAKKYGAMFILLPLSEKGLPKDLEEKKQIIHSIVEAALQIGLAKEDIIVDGLVNTIGANKQAAIETLETIRYCRETLELATIVGLSNISFGLPERQFVNSTFLAFAIQAGLTMAISNPSQELLVNTAFAADLLLSKENSDIRYIDQVTSNPVIITTPDKLASVNEQPSVGKQPMGKESVDTTKDKTKRDVIFEAVLKGNQKGMLNLVKEALELGEEPNHILNEKLIPAINEVGDLFEKQIYFLPQLIGSAGAMKIAIDYLEPLLEKTSNGKKLGTIVIATVSGDIHDIGKNLVALMLKNYGFDVIDLGKDVPSEKIIETAKEVDADIVALSALMTTTMLEMKVVVDLVKEAKLRAKVIIGGAVITDSYAKEIEADGYSKDANEAVVLVKRLLNIVD